MIQFDEDILVNHFSGLPFEVKGVGIFKTREGKQFVAKKTDHGDYVTIGLDGNTSGAYLRFSGKTGNVREGEKISCSDQIYYETAEIHLVVGLNKMDMQSVFDAVKMKVAQLEGTKIRSTDISKDNILREENMGMNDLDMFKITFDYEYNYVAPCASDILCC